MAALALIPERISLIVSHWELFLVTQYEISLVLSSTPTTNPSTSPKYLKVARIVPQFMRIKSTAKS